MSEKSYGAWAKSGRGSFSRKDMAIEVFSKLLDDMRDNGENMEYFTFSIVIDNESDISTLGMRATPKPKLKERDK